MPELVLPPVRPNGGLRAWYRRKLQRLVFEMSRSMLLHIRAAWRESPPAIGFAHDESATAALERATRKWGERWIERFEDAAEEIARAFAKRSARDFDVRFRKILRDAGFTVRFKPTRGQVEAYRSVVAENVNLIRSIPERFLTDVKSVVWQSVMKGNDMAGMGRALRKTYGIAWRRADLIARDQTNKARAVMEEARRKELGIREAIWCHSGAGKEPRPEHVRWGEKKQRYDISKGLWSKVDQEWVWPGTAINCRCTSNSVFRTPGPG